MNKISSHFLFALFGMVWISGCATINHTHVAPQVMGPLLPQNKSLFIEGNVVPSRSVELYQDASQRPPSRPSCVSCTHSTSSTLLPALGYVPLKWFSLSGGFVMQPTFDPLFDGVWLSGRVQVVGPTGLTRENSKWSVTVDARGGSQGGSSSGDQKGQFGPGGYPWKATREGGFASATLSLGYSVRESFTPFIGLGFGSSNTKVKVDQDRSSDGTSAGGSYESSSSAVFSVYGAGIQFGGPSAQFEAGFQRTGVNLDKRLRVWDSSVVVGGRIWFGGVPKAHH